MITEKKFIDHNKTLSCIVDTLVTSEKKYEVYKELINPHTDEKFNIENGCIEVPLNDFTFDEGFENLPSCLVKKIKVAIKKGAELLHLKVK